MRPKELEPPMVIMIGVLLAMVGFILFAGTMFASGGASKSQQFRVIGEVLDGRHGAGRRVTMKIGGLLMPLGMVVAFAGIAMGDRERADRCVQRCLREGYASGQIGPSDERVSGRVAYVACTCMRPDGARSQHRADE